MDRVNADEGSAAMKPRIIFDVETDADVLALAELAPEFGSVVELLREHIDNSLGKPLCGVEVFEVALLVDAALASDCDACRTLRGIDPERGQSALPEWTPQPMDGAETMLDEKRKRDDGQ